MFNKWNKIVVFKSNQYSDPNGWMELVSNTAIKLEDCDTVHKKSEKEIMNTIITGLPYIYNNQGIRRDLRRYLSEQGANLKDLKKQVNREWKEHIKPLKSVNKMDKKTVVFSVDGKGGTRKSGLTCAHCGLKGHKEKNHWKKHGKT